jgi:hypothetical protein
MKNALPLVGRILGLAASNPALLVVTASLSVPLAFLYAALSYVAASPVNLLAFIVVGALCLVYSGWIARLALRHWTGLIPPRAVEEPVERHSP